MNKKPIIAIMYDFDKTLCTEDMQNYKFIPDVKMTPAEFWGATGEFGEKHKVERILAYMHMMIKEAKNNDIKLSKEYLESLGKYIKYYKGVETWFDRINKYGQENGVKIEHYVISSGVKEIIEGSSIAKKFTQIYACEYLYNSEGEACWPKLTINYTQKTQFIYRIRKGVKDITNDDDVNKKTPSNKKRVQYANMIYIGDGITDIPCMQMIKDNGGISIALYNNSKVNHAKELSRDDRVNYIFKADYQEGGKLEQTIKDRISFCALKAKLENTAERQKAEIMKDDE